MGRARKCLLCRLGYKVPALPMKTKVSLEVDHGDGDIQQVFLCELHDRLYYGWGTEEDRMEMRRLMSPYIYGGLKTRSRLKPEKRILTMWRGRR